MNKLAESYDRQIKEVRNNFYNNIEKGIREELLIRQIGKPPFRRMSSQTKNITKEYLFYDSFVNRQRNTKYKKRFEIKNGELEGIKAR